MRCGVDEAGRGPIAGPVTAGAVVLPPDFPTDRLDDSKKLTPEVREELAIIIRRDALAWAVGWCWADEIDRFNIHRASLLAMVRAVRALPLQPDEVLVDGRFVPPLRMRCQAIIGGDA